MADIKLNGNDVVIDGSPAGKVVDAIANYPEHAYEIQALWDAAHPPEPQPE